MSVKGLLLSVLKIVLATIQKAAMTVFATRDSEKMEKIALVTIAIRTLNF